MTDTGCDTTFHGSSQKALSRIAAKERPHEPASTSKPFRPAAGVLGQWAAQELNRATSDATAKPTYQSLASEEGGSCHTFIVAARNHLRLRLITEYVLEGDSADVCEILGASASTPLVLHLVSNSVEADGDVPFTAADEALLAAAEAAEADEQRKLRAGLDDAYATERAAWDFLPHE